MVVGFLFVFFWGSGEHVEGSPFQLRVMGAPDASKVRVHGPGIEHGVLATFQSRFLCDTRGAGAGQVRPCSFFLLFCVLLFETETKAHRTTGFWVPPDSGTRQIFGTFSRHFVEICLAESAMNHHHFSIELDKIV